MRVQVGKKYEPPQLKFATLHADTEATTTDVEGVQDSSAMGALVLAPITPSNYGPSSSSSSITTNQASGYPAATTSTYSGECMLLNVIALYCVEVGS